MLGLLTTILGGWWVGGWWVVGLGFCKIKANSAQLELELGLSLATSPKEMFVPAIIVGKVVPEMIVGTAVPTIIVLMAYYWKSW